MRIGIDARWIFHQISGIGAYTLALIEHLAKIEQDEHTFILFFNHDSLLERTLDQAGIRNHPRVTCVLIPYGVHSPLSQLRLPGVLKQQKLDIFHSTNYMIPLLAFPSKRTGKIRCITTIHDMIPMRFPNAAPNSKKTRLFPLYKKLMRMGLFTALAIAIHNFPEGLATFLAALEDPSLGIPIAIAIALHNIPEGISVSVPIFYATGDRRKAFIYSFLSGLAEPVGAIIAYMALRFFFGGDSGAIPSQVMGILFGGVAGIMVYISLDELLPTSRAYGKGHDSLFGLVAGMVVMALSLLLMR